MSEKFEVGKTYSTGEGRDYVWRFRVTRRTAKFITISEIVNGYEPEPPKRVGVKVGWGGNEYALPLGSYSMAPVISADRIFVAVPA
jgi:hypothetical protein